MTDERKILVVKSGVDVKELTNPRGVPGDITVWELNELTMRAVLEHRSDEQQASGQTIEPVGFRGVVK